MELYPTLENRLPPQAEVYPLKTPDGFELRGMKCGSGERGTIVLLTGRSDYMERYFETMRDLVARGFCVASFDWRGQGGSDRRQAAQRHVPAPMGPSLNMGCE